MKAATQLLPRGTTIEIFDIAGIPGYNLDLEKNPPVRAVELKKVLREVDVLLFATPEYNYSVPGVLKDAIDWASRPLNDNAWYGKPAAILGASTGMFGSARAQYHLRQIFVTLNIYAVNQPEVMIARAKEHCDSDGRLIDQTSRELIRQLLTNLVQLTHKLRDSAVLMAS